MNLDQLITGGMVISPQGRQQASIGIVGERIVGIFEPGHEPTAAETIDATGLAVLPGVVDMHSHHRAPGFEHKETLETASAACAAGGVTTSVAMPNVDPPPTTLALLEDMFAMYEKRFTVDFNVNPAPTVAEEIPKMAATGIAAFKVFMVTDTGRDYPHMPGIGIHDYGHLMAIMKQCQEAGTPLMVHPHEQDLMDHIEQTFWDRGERDALAYARAYAAHDGVIWDTAIGTLLRLQQATGVHLHLLHLQTSGSVELLRHAKRRGQRVSAEINPWALFLGCDWENIEKWGSYALSYWVPEKNVEPLWGALNDGTIDIVATDHAPHTREEKEIGWEDGWKAHTGTPSTQFVLSLLLTAVSEGRISLERVVEVTAARPARLFGLERKGRIAVGADADLVLVDLEAQHRITHAEVLSRCGWTPYADRLVTGLPVRTLVRGRTVFADGEVQASGGGQLARASGRQAHQPAIEYTA